MGGRAPGGPRVKRIPSISVVEPLLERTKSSSPGSRGGNSTLDPNSSSALFAVGWPVPVKGVDEGVNGC